MQEGAIISLYRTNTAHEQQLTSAMRSSIEQNEYLLSSDSHVLVLRLKLTKKNLISLVGCNNLIIFIENLVI